MPQSWHIPGSRGGTVSKMLYDLAQEIVYWIELHLVAISARYILGKKNIPVAQLSYPDQVLSTEWFLLPRVFDTICEVFSRPHIDLLL